MKKSRRKYRELGDGKESLEAEEDDAHESNDSNEDGAAGAEEQRPSQLPGQ